MTSCALVINAGSSSIKAAAFSVESAGQRLWTAKVEGSGLDAFDRLIADFHAHVAQARVVAIGHRIVHGGPRFAEPEMVDAAFIEQLGQIAPLAPEHVPAEIAIVEACTRQFNDVPQLACFDTAFHHNLPRVARVLPIARSYEAAGVRRYGFHGLSYAYLIEELAKVAGGDAAQGRVVLAHLGAGASMAAVREGRCIDTTMAMTPTAGLVMATRSGDLDPGLMLYLLREQRMTVDDLDALVNRRSGLLGLSETSADMRQLLAVQHNDPRAAEAVEAFCYSARKWLGALAAALGGVDTIVFAGGIGENSPEVRDRICQGLDHLGVAIDSNRNQSNQPIISIDGSRVVARMIKTDEERMIFREVRRRLLDKQAEKETR